MALRLGLEIYNSFIPKSLLAGFLKQVFPTYRYREATETCITATERGFCQHLESYIVCSGKKVNEPLIDI